LVADLRLRNSSGNFATFAAIRRPSRFGAARRKLFRPVTLPSARNMQRNKREIHGQNQAKADAFVATGPIDLTSPAIEFGFRD
jgi:hypothetical protein